MKQLSEKTLNYANDLKQTMNKEIRLSRNADKRATTSLVTKDLKRLPSIFKTNSISCVERALIKRGTFQFNNDPHAHSVFSGNLLDIFNNNNSNTIVNHNSKGNSSSNKNNKTNLILNKNKTIIIKDKDKERDIISNIKLRKDLTLKQLMSVNIKNLIPYEIKYSNAICQNAQNNSIRTKTKGFSISASTIDLMASNKFQTIKVLIKRPKKSEPFLKKLLSLNTDNTKHLQILFKLKCIKWLWKCKSIAIEKLIFSYHHFKWFFKKYENIERKRFIEFLVLLEVGKDEELSEQLYLIYGQNKSNTMNIKECLFMFVLTSNFSYEKKIILLIEVANDDNAKRIPLAKLLKYLSITLPIKDYYDCVNVVKKAVKTDEVGVEELVVKLVASKQLKIIFKNYYSFFANIDNKMKEELNATFNVSLKYFMYVYCSSFFI